MANHEKLVKTMFVFCTWILVLLLSSTSVASDDDTSSEIDFKLIKISSDLRLSAGDDAVLECQFDQPVECLWFRQSVSVEINDRYAYTVERSEFDSDEKDNITGDDDDGVSKDCSIFITGVSAVDFGSWQCQGERNDHHIISPEIHLTQNHGLELVTAPANVSAKLWDSVTLNCKFNQPVQQCQWYRDGYLYDLYYNSKFVSFETGKSTDDCSLELSAILNKDIARWECSGESELDAVRSKPAWIKINNGLPVEERPVNVKAASGTRAVLQCGFPQPAAHCIWYHGGARVTIHGGYSFLEANSNKTATKNCSIVITTVSAWDFGDWTCQGINQYGTNTLKTIYLTDSEFNADGALQLIHHPANVSVPLAKSVDLHCRFNRPVDCSWTRGGVAVEFGQRYKHVGSDNGTATEDCSVRVRAVLNDDYQNWVCTGTTTNEKITSKPVWIGELPKLRITDQPTGVTSQKGSNLTLTCRFNQAVHCSWSRRGHRVEDLPGSRYSYASAKNSTLNNATDCSFQITPLLEEDFSLWICKGANRFEEKQSDIAWVRNVTRRSTTSASLRAVHSSEDSAGSKSSSSLVIYIFIALSLLGIVSVGAVVYTRQRSQRNNSQYRLVDRSGSTSKTPLIYNANQGYFDEYVTEDNVFDNIARLRFL